MNDPRQSPTSAEASDQGSFLEILCQNFAVFREVRPLAIGLHKAIREHLPETKSDALRPAMKRHTTSTRYLKALVAGDTRFDLDGNPAGSVTDEQREVARVALRERFNGAVDRRREEQRAKERLAKLLQLAAKFSKS